MIRAATQHGPTDLYDAHKIIHCFDTSHVLIGNDVGKLYKLGSQGVAELRPPKHGLRLVVHHSLIANDFTGFIRRAPASATGSPKPSLSGAAPERRAISTTIYILRETRLATEVSLINSCRWVRFPFPLPILLSFVGGVPAVGL